MSKELDKGKSTKTGIFFRAESTLYNKFSIKLLEENNGREEVLRALMKLYIEKGEEVLIFKKKVK